MFKYKEPKDYKNIHEFMDEYGNEIYKGEVKEGYMMEAVCDFMLEMATSDLRAATSQLKRLYMYLLKYKYQKERQSRSWINTIRDSSRELDDALSIKSLANKIDLDCQMLLYQNARRYAAAETGLPEKVFPKELPDEFNIENIRDTNYIEQYLRLYAYSNNAKKELGI